MGRRRRGSGQGPHGIAFVDKPSGPTSSRVVRAVGRTLEATRVGHAGTLDPMATGVLVVLLGEATKLSPWVMGQDKRYRATIALGTATDTLDAEGAVVAEAAISASAWDGSEIDRCLERLAAETLQTPPAYSALKREGRTLMSRARAGEDVRPEPRPSTCHSLKRLSVDSAAGTIDVSVHCGSGYYVRSMARDLGLALGTIAHLGALRRTAVGPFTEADLANPDTIDPSEILPIPAVFERLDMDVHHASIDEARLVFHGRSVPAIAGKTGVSLVIAPDGMPVAMVKSEDGVQRVVRGLRCSVEPPDWTRIEVDSAQ